MRYLVCCLLLFIAFPVQALQDGQASVRVDILAVDDRAYPEIDIALTVTDVVAAEPVDDVASDGFLVTTTNDRPLEVLSLERGDRPVHLMVVLDRTSSVSDKEFNNMRDAAGLLIASLGVKDQVGVVTMDHAGVELLQPLSPDHNAAINAMHLGDIGPVVNQSGNVVADGVYQAVEALVTPGPTVRPTVVVFTDVPDDFIGGERDLEDIQALATERGTTVHVIYFETETDDGLLAVPDELQTLANDTGGVVVTHGGFENPDDPQDYSDDDYLPEMAQQIADILEQEYRLRVRSPLMPDDQVYALRVVVTVRGIVSAVAESDYQARSGFVDLHFDGLEDGQRVQLPQDVQVLASASTGELETLELYRIDNTTGDAILMEVLSFEEPVFTLTPDQVSPGLLTLKVAGADSLGNRDETYLTLLVEDSESASPNATLAQVDTPANDDNGSGMALWQVGLITVITGLAGSLLSLILLAGFRRRRSGMPPPMPIAPVRVPTPSVAWDDPLEAQTQISDRQEIGLMTRAVLVGANREQYPLYEGENTVGRHGSNMIQLMDSTASRYHAVIEIMGESIEYMDWQASHPSIINGQPVESGRRYILKDGDQIRIGMSVFRILIT